MDDRRAVLRLGRATKAWKQQDKKEQARWLKRRPHSSFSFRVPHFPQVAADYHRLFYPT
jgi:hypothetical protein